METAFDQIGKGVSLGQAKGRRFTGNLSRVSFPSGGSFIHSLTSHHDSLVKFLQNANPCREFSSKPLKMSPKLLRPIIIYGH